MKKILTLIVFLTLTFNVQAFENDFDALLKTHVKTTTKLGIQYNAVNYAAWAKDKRHEKVRDALLKTDTNSLKTKNQQLAFWINAYNLLTIDLITRENETKSIKNLGTLLKSPWKRYKWDINGKKFSLDDIEHKVIRKLKEPRIHFAINCAAISCPDLRKEAYRADKLEWQLQNQVNLTLGNTSKGFKVINDNEVRVTKVMDWFNQDFIGGINKWLQSYKNQNVKDKTRITFFKYDWSLNSI